MKIGEGISGALFNDSSHMFRYALWRTWEPTGHKLLFIGLNPSTANDTRNDPTIRRLIGFAKSWGFGGLFAGNLFSLVSAYPDVLWLKPASDLSRGLNDTAIKRMRELSTKVIVGWGNQGRNAGTRPAEVLALVGEPVYCLKTKKTGEPSHPLYFPRDSKLIRYYRKA
jgi:hypothetical protein